MSIERLYPNSKEREQRITNIREHLRVLEDAQNSLVNDINKLLLELNILIMMSNLEKVENGELDINILAEQQSQKTE